MRISAFLSAQKSQPPISAIANKNFTMNEDFRNEIEAINSIYGDDTLVATDEEGVFILRLPQQDASLRIFFPESYPAAPLAVLGTQSSGEHIRKGDAAYVVGVFRDTVGRLYQPGEVCMFDVIEEFSNIYSNTSDPQSSFESDERQSETLSADNGTEDIVPPPWKLSDVVIELKSVFIARCAPVSSPDQAKLFLQHLLDTDKKVRSATHNITAWRIKGENGVTYQDCDDDGETAAGGRVLHLMQLMDIWNVMVVVTRWYGGHQLGPKRFSIINTVARDVFVKGGFFKEDNITKKKNKH